MLHVQSKEHLRLPEHRWRNKLGESTTDPDMIDVDSVTASPDQITKWSVRLCNLLHTLWG